MIRWRINLIFIFIILIGAAIIGRLIYYQIYKHNFYRALALGQQRDFLLREGERGEIFMKGGEILATKVKKEELFISPAQITEKEKTSRVLSSILGLEEKELLEKMKKDSLYEKINIEIGPEKKQEILNLNLEGVFFKEVSKREYPYKTLASHVVGFLGGEGEGQYGVEGYYDDILQGKTTHFSSEDFKGANLYLTLDYNIQFMAEKLLKEAKEELEIRAGQILVEDPNTGRILALASFPNFDPNEYYKEKDFSVFQNPAIQEAFEPGSVFKPITMAGALEENKITPQTKYIDKGVMEIGGYKIYNYARKTWGEKTMTEVLEKSINTGAIFAERKLGHKLFLEYLEKFGFFEPTGIDLQGEIFSENKEFRKGYEINFATASFGQGIEITPLQLIRAFSAIANGGKLIKPYVVEKIKEKDKIIEIKPEIQRENVISQKTASQLTAMLVSVIEHGFGKSAKIPGYYIAGKTGTSQIPFSALGIKKRGYSNETWQSFIGFAPAFNPSFVILVKLDNPKTKTAEYSAVPIFRKLAKYIIDYMQIPPDYE